jgi:hypothetical protein
VEREEQETPLTEEPVGAMAHVDERR